ncbi:hypothetical protein [Marinobacterium sp. MBR-109]|jgi:hypothetical protein|uniref:HTH domain-containing protein n=1 Tax=Marinobacterium sp. MBR-109 TaxID=3156462 RepID=UPI00339425D8
MLKRTNQKANAGDHATILQAGRDINLNIPTELVNNEIEKELQQLRKSRFFREVDNVRSSLRFGKRLVDGDLSGGSDALRSLGLAWCSRLLAPTEQLDQAKEFLGIANTLGESPENKIANAFILSREYDKTTALQALVDLDTPAACSARLMIVAHHESAESALKWMTDANYSAENLDPDGKSFLLSLQLQLARWESASQTVSTLSQESYDEAPILHHLAALSTLIPTIPQDYRAFVLTQVPFEAREFPLATDSLSLNARRSAHQHFVNATNAAIRLSCSRTASMDDEYAIWLELRDPLQAPEGVKRLEEKLRTPDTALRFVHYALQFNIKLDLEAVERDIDRDVAKNGAMTEAAAIARFAIAFTKPTAAEVADYIARHHSQLAMHIDPKTLRFRQIEMFSHAGLIEQAYEILNHLIEQKITVDEENNLRRIIYEAQGNNNIDSRKQQYISTKSLDDLVNLVAELERNQYWDDLCKFAKLLFNETRSLNDAERLAKALNITHRSEELVCFLNEYNELLSQSNNLRISYAWALYEQGDFLKSRAVLSELDDNFDGLNHRALLVNLGIATGDWESLSTYIENEYQNRESRSSASLISTAKLAVQLGSPRAKELVFSAAENSPDDPAVLASSYLIATSAGWEVDPIVLQWIEKAVEHSDENGPLRIISLKDLLDRKPEWDRNESDTWRLLSQGRIPIFLAAELLNRTLVELTTLPTLSNLIETDPRRRSMISTYSGKRSPVSYDLIEKTVAIDATALLTLSFLKILDLVLDTLGTIYIPHTTLGWLFEERQKARFHQPSRIADAHNIRDLLATDALEKFAPSTVADSNLSTQVGETLSALIAEAEKEQDNNFSQKLVVRPAPVYRVSSLMEEEADLSSHTAVMSSCLAVVEKLRQNGQITAKELKRSKAYLQLREKPWPNQPNIEDGATLYLDDLAITYFLHLGILEKLKPAGFIAVASPREVSEVDSLIAYESTSEEINNIIERIRESLHSRLESGQVRIGAKRYFEDNEKDPNPDHPSIGIISLAPLCDIAIIDDRFINQHAVIEEENSQLPVLSTLDLIDTLVTACILSCDDRLEYRTTLRKAGYTFIPVDVSELEECIQGAAVKDEYIIETAELKAIRESISRVRMSDWLQMPEESPWLHGTIKTFIQVLRNIWIKSSNIDENVARSNWLIKQIDIRGWAHVFNSENAENLVKIGHASYTLMLLMRLDGVHESVRSAYWNWIEESVLLPLQEQFPEIYEIILDRYRNYIDEMSEVACIEGASS